MKSPFVSTHSISSIISILIFLNIINKDFLRYKIKNNKQIIVLILFFLVSNSISILNSQNIDEFLRIYKNVVIGIIFFFNSAYFSFKSKNISKIFFVIMLALFFNLIYKIAIFFDFTQLVFIIKDIIYDKYSNFIEIQKQRGRFFIELYDWVFFPLFILFFIEKNFLKKLIALVSTLLFLFLSIVSGYRVIFITVIFSLFLSFIFLKKEIEIFYINKKNLFFLLFSNFFFILIFLFLLNKNNYPNSIQRLTNIDVLNETTIIRIKYWQKSWDMFLSSIITGIGLGNFYDYLDNKETIVYSLFDPKNFLMKITATDPHNIFARTLAETGLLGFLSLVFLLIYFFYQDFNNFFRKKIKSKFFILCFWLLIMFVLVSPSFSLQFYIFFWFLRGIIYGSSF